MVAVALRGRNGEKEWHDRYKGELEFFLLERKGDTALQPFSLLRLDERCFVVEYLRERNAGLVRPALSVLPMRFELRLEDAEGAGGRFGLRVSVEGGRILRAVRIPCFSFIGLGACRRRSVVCRDDIHRRRIWES